MNNRQNIRIIVCLFLSFGGICFLVWVKCFNQQARFGCVANARLNGRVTDHAPTTADAMRVWEAALAGGFGLLKWPAKKLSILNYPLSIVSSGLD
jgi:hypothetical protein